MAIGFINATTNVAVFCTPNKDSYRSDKMTTQWIYEIIIFIAIILIPILITYTENKLKTKIENIKLRMTRNSEMSVEMELLI